MVLCVQKSIHSSGTNAKNMLLTQSISVRPVQDVVMRLQDSLTSSGTRKSAEEVRLQETELQEHDIKSYS